MIASGKGEFSVIQELIKNGGMHKINNVIICFMAVCIAFNVKSSRKFVKVSWFPKNLSVVRNSLSLICSLSENC